MSTQRLWLVGATALASAVALAACSPTSTQSPTTPSPTPTSASAEETAVLDTYEGAREVYVAMLRGETDLDTAGEELEAYATGQAYESLLQDGNTFSEAGIVFEGEPGMDPQVTGVDMDATPAQATLTDCWDTTNWQPLRNGTPLEKAPDQNQRQVLNIRVEQQDDGAWLLTELAPEEGRTC